MKKYIQMKNKEDIINNFNTFIYNTYTYKEKDYKNLQRAKLGIKNLLNTLESNKKDLNIEEEYKEVLKGFKYFITQLEKIDKKLAD
jgi:soluble cytochrome b562